MLYFKSSNKNICSIKHFLIGMVLISMFLTSLGVNELNIAYAQDLVTTHTMQDQILYEWSPTSNTLIYLSLNLQDSGPGLQSYDLNVYNAETGQKYRLASEGHIGPVKFSDDGSSISFWYDNTPYIAYLSGASITPTQILPDKPTIKGAFSADNNLLLYVSENDEVRIRNLTTAQESTLGIFTNVSTLPYLFPEWSPDNEWVALGYETGGLILDPEGTEESISLPYFRPPQSEISPTHHYFEWSDGGNSLYSNGILMYSENIKIEPPSANEKNNVSFDKSFEVLDSEGELILHQIQTGENIQLTLNKETQESINDISNYSLQENTIQAIANGFDYPVGKPDGAGYNTTAGCWWLQRDGACAPGPHPGQDFNGNGGGDSDLGYPVYAVANGVVLFSGQGTGSSWGNIILIEHTLPDGTKVWSQYAHLKDRFVNSGVTVNKGDQIGTIGKGYNNIYLAHLHFEIRIQYRAADAWISGWSDSQVLQFYVNPSDYINNHRNISGSTCSTVNGEIKLYDGTNCGGGQFSASGPGLYDMASIFNDKAESIAIPSGWSARLYADNTESSPNLCINSTDSNLWDNTFNNGGVVANQSTWVRVYNNSNCSGSSTGSWTANYYDTIDRWWDNNNNNNFRCSENVGGPVLDKNYGTSGPCGMDGDTWIGDYTGVINFAAGNYVFLVDHDDGAKLWLNGSNIADYGGSGSSTAVCPARYVSGNTTLRAMLREDGGDARIKVSWTTNSAVCEPTAPSNLRTTSTTQDSITFAWNDNSGNENGFKIYRWNGSNWQNINNVGANTSSYTDTVLACGSTYDYDVSAFNDYGEVISSGNFLTASTSACPTVPNMPSNFRVIATNQTSLTLAWDDQNNELGYKVYKWNGVEFQPISTLGINTTNFTDTSLPCDSDQFYKVSSYNSVGESIHAGWIVGRTNSCTAECVPVQGITLGGYDTHRNDGVGSQNSIMKYGGLNWIESGPEFTYYLDLNEDKSVVVQLSEMATDLDVFVLSGESGQCHSSNLITFGNSTATFEGSAGKRYYLVVDGYQGAIGNYRIEVVGNSSIFLPIIVR